jgi:hypothetical protein
LENNILKILTSLLIFLAPIHPDDSVVPISEDYNSDDAIMKSDCDSDAMKSDCDSDATDFNPDIQSTPARKIAASVTSVPESQSDAIDDVTDFNSFDPAISSTQKRSYPIKVCQFA